MDQSTVPGWLAIAALTCLAFSALCLVGLLAHTIHHLTQPRPDQEP